MYLKETIDSFASNANILKLLKKDAQFNHHCIEEMVSKGTELIYNRDREYFYLIEQGYVKYEYDGQLGRRFHFLFGPGSFPFLPIYEDDVPNISKIEMLADVRWWRVEFSFLRRLCGWKIRETIFCWLIWLAREESCMRLRFKIG
ncbi:Uncharacterised protein [Listeria booriae]|nr:Uncharacterised protein [Listeria booriae]